MDPSGLPYPAFRALRRSSPQDQAVSPQAPEENLYEDIGDVVVQGPLEPSPLAASAPAQSAPAPGAAAAPAFTLLADLGPSAPPLSAPPLAPSAPPPSLAPSAPPPSLPPAPPPRGGFQAMHAAAAPVGLIAGPGAREGGSDVADGWRLHPRPGPPPVPQRRPPGVVQRRFSCDLTVPSIKRSGTDTDVSSSPYLNIEEVLNMSFLLHGQKGSYYKNNKMLIKSVCVCVSVRVCV